MICGVTAEKNQIGTETANLIPLNPEKPKPRCDFNYHFGLVIINVCRVAEAFSGFHNVRKSSILNLRKLVYKLIAA